MHTFHFIVPGRLPGLNKIIAAARKSPYASARLKKDAEDMVGWAIKSGKPRGMRFASPVEVTLCFYEKDKKRDPDNVLSALKFVMDALVANRVITADGWKHLNMPAPFGAPRFYIDKEDPRIEVFVRGEIAYEVV